MNPIKVLNSFAAPAGVMAIKSGDANASALLQKGNPLFGSLLMSMTEETTAELPADQNDAQSLMEMLGSVIDGLQELQQESESPEEQEIMYEAMQFLALHGKQIEEMIKQAAVNPPTDKTDQRMTETTSPDAIKLAEVIRQLGQIVQGKKAESLAEDAIRFAAPLSIEGVEGEKTSADLPKIVQLIQKVETILNEFRQQTITDQTGKPILMTRTEQSPVRQVVELSAAGVSAVPDETVQLENQLESRLAPMAAEPVKMAPILQRTELAPAPPTVRMSHLAEELGEIMRNSMRLTSTGEATQIRVNIFPEHLGHLDIRLTEMNGRIAAQIFTGSMATKEALDMQVNHMRQTLLQQGITLDKIEVVQQNTQQSMGQQAQTDQRFAQQQRKGNFGRDSNAYASAEEETAVIRSQVPDGLMKVDYTV